MGPREHRRSVQGFKPLPLFVSYTLPFAFHAKNLDLVGAIVAMFVLAVVFEGLRTLQEFLAYLAATLSKQTLTKNDMVIEMLPRKSCCSENGGDCNPPSARKPSKFLTW